LSFRSTAEESASVFASESLFIEMNVTARAENHACHEKQTESLPIPDLHQSKNLWHGNVPEKLKKQG
jgi:hypothetical protein